MIVKKDAEGFWALRGRWSNNPWQIKEKPHCSWLRYLFNSDKCTDDGLESFISSLSSHCDDNDTGKCWSSEAQLGDIELYCSLLTCNFGNLLQVKRMIRKTAEIWDTNTGRGLDCGRGMRALDAAFVIQLVSFLGRYFEIVEMYLLNSRSMYNVH